MPRKVRTGGRVGIGQIPARMPRKIAGVIVDLVIPQPAGKFDRACGIELERARPQHPRAEEFMNGPALEPFRPAAATQPQSILHFLIVEVDAEMLPPRIEPR